MIFITVLKMAAFTFSVFINLLFVILCVQINLMNPMKSGSITSAPSASNFCITKLFPKGWYFIRTSPTIPTFGFSIDISTSIFSKSSTISWKLFLKSLPLLLLIISLHFSIHLSNNIFDSPLFISYALFLAYSFCRKSP